MSRGHGGATLAVQTGRRFESKVKEWGWRLAFVRRDSTDRRRRSRRTADKLIADGVRDPAPCPRPHGPASAAGAGCKVKGVREAIQARGAELRNLPPYSPDMNPIEPMWSKVKTMIRKAKACEVKPLYEAISAVLYTVTAEELNNYYTDCGYATGG